MSQNNANQHMANYRGVKIHEAICREKQKSCTCRPLKICLLRSNGSTPLKFFLITQHEVPFINTSEATKRTSDRTENGKCADVTNSRSREG